jgi:aspartate/methionine/tyrosine aminotransferase
VNQMLCELVPHSSKRISDYVASYPDIIDLSVGAPSFGPPQSFRQALAALTRDTFESAARHDHYAHSRGTPELRAAVAQLYEREQGCVIDPDTQVLITNGAAGALWASLLAVTEPGDEVLLPDPGYMIYPPVVQLLGRRVVRVPTNPASGFRLEVEHVERHLGKHSRLVVVNSPANPTGATFRAEQLRQLCELAAANEVHVVHDEVLDRFSYRTDHRSVVAVDPCGVGIAVNSLSKRFGMTGWRVGWLVADEHVVTQAAKAHAFFTLAVGHAVQLAAAVALTDDLAEADVTRHALEIRHRGARFLDGLQQVPDLVVPDLPSGGFYAFVDVRPFASRRALSAGGAASVSEAVAEYLLNQRRVAVVPGSAFGTGGEGFVRMSFAGSDEQLVRAFQQMASG